MCLYSMQVLSYHLLIVLIIKGLLFIGNLLGNSLIPLTFCSSKLDRDRFFDTRRSICIMSLWIHVDNFKILVDVPR